MKATQMLLLALTGAFLSTPLSAALADPWKHERRWERYEERRWREHERRAERAWRQEQRERRAAHERYRAYEQGRAEGYRESAQQNPVAVLGQLLSR